VAAVDTPAARDIGEPDTTGAELAHQQLTPPALEMCRFDKFPAINNIGIPPDSGAVRRDGIVRKYG